VLQIDNVGKYNNQFLRFEQNNEIDIHFTIRKHGVAKEMNLFLLEKIRHLLSNAQLGNSFRAEVVEYACHLINKLSSTASLVKLY